MGTFTPLAAAVCFNNQAAVQACLAAGADASLPFVVQGVERTCLQVARSRNLRHVIKLIEAALPADAVPPPVAPSFVPFKGEDQ